MNLPCLDKTLHLFRSFCNVLWPCW